MTRSGLSKIVLGVGVFCCGLAAFGVSFPNVELAPLGAGVAFASWLIP